MNQLSFFLVVAVLFDTFIVRLFLVPAMMGTECANFAMPFYTKNVINLPRQARDKHRETLKKVPRFPYCI
jgi:uncharacterized membrane protein YdfJ with MMPL/SSD domain